MSNLNELELRKKRKGICIIKYCGNKASKRSLICSKHLQRRYRKKYPIKYAYDTLKTNAKRRKIEFIISFEYFKEFCIKTELLVGRGRTKTSYSLDRIDETKGYVEGNLQKLKVGENIKKSLVYDKENKTGRYYIHSNFGRKEKDNDVPF